MFERTLASLLFVTAMSCAGGYPKPVEAPKPAPAAAPAPLAVEAAALPYRFVDRSGREVPAAEAVTRIQNAKVACLGEVHDDPHHHWAQLEIVKLAMAATPTVWGLGMEMFQRPYQGALDDFSAGRIDEATMLARSEWAKRWGFDFALYRPIIAAAVNAKAALVALNPAKELVKKVSKQGIAALSPQEREQLPDMVLDEKSHRAWWGEIMVELAAAHAKPAPSAGAKPEPTPTKTPEEIEKAKADKAAAMERMYSVQVLWDESMAQTAAAFVAADQNRRMLILAGNGHCHDAGVPNRLRRRGVTETVSVLPIVDDGKNVAEELAKPHNDLLLVMRAQ